MDYIVERANASDSLLIVDDVYDTGLSIKAVIDTLQERMRKNIPQQIKVATVLKKEPPTTGQRPVGCSPLRGSGRFLWSARIFPRDWWRAKPYATGQRPGGKFCAFYKPRRNKTTRQPDYFLHETESWIIFPHELQGLDEEELRTGKGLAIYEILKKIP